MHVAVLLLGTNMGDRTRSLSSALLRLEEAGEVTKASAIYETEPWGNKDQPTFLNQVITIKTTLTARQLLSVILDIERKMGREREVKWAPRIIDIDILFYDDDIIHEEGLAVPHPLLQERRFALAPLAELMPEYVHPVLKLKVNELYKSCIDKLKVQLYIEPYNDKREIPGLLN